MTRGLMCCAALVVAGGMTSAGRPFTWRDPLGMLMALASTVAISVYFVLVALTHGRLSDAAILYINYLAVRRDPEALPSAATCSPSAVRLRLRVRTCGRTFCSISAVCER